LYIAQEPESTSVAALLVKAVAFECFCIKKHRGKSKMKNTKRLFMVLLGIVMVFAITSCEGSEPEPEPQPEPRVEPDAPASPATPAAPTTAIITFVNDTIYNFQAIFISPIASNVWGSDLLGDTSILKSDGGQINLNIELHEANSFDMRIVDEDRDEYYFERVPLVDGYTVAITWDGGLSAVVADSAGTIISTVGGAMPGSGGDEEAYVDDYEEPASAGTGHATNGRFSFTMYNESSFTIYSIHIVPSGAVNMELFDFLPRTIPAGESFVLEGTIGDEYWNVTEWTLHVTDVDGDTSVLGHETFNVWEISYADIHWDSSQGGYVCEFVY
jgi:hypothetical protein